MKQLLKAFTRDERGVSAMEYAILATAVIVAVAGIGAGYRTQISSMFTTLFSQANSTQNSN
ncbi:Flp family type IVb pilin [Burkholderia sp. 22PA0106]|uniref:Flp family type IVb pilin n=1 Tax=Burkholderia sp. 22PA0106 TaxID=3237371 RepID=UPI0039C3411D